MTLDAAYLARVEQRSRERVGDAFENLPERIGPMMTRRSAALTQYGEFREALGAWRGLQWYLDHCSPGTRIDWVSERQAVAEARLQAACAAVMEDR